MKKNTRIFGLTGNIGTGKSTVAWMFSEMGVPILDADEIAHESLAPHSTVWKAIFERYGKDVISRDNEIDRRMLSSIVFEDDAERRFLESIIHPYVRREISQRASDLSKKGELFVIAEVPLLLEAGWQDDFDAIIVVRCDQEQEIARCKEKFGMERKEVLQRLAAQYPLERKVAGADAVIDNAGTFDETRVQVYRLHQEMIRGTFPPSK